MAVDRKRGRAEERPAASLQTDWRHLVVVGGLLATVLGTLILGAVLEADPDPLETLLETRSDREVAAAPAPAPSDDPELIAIAPDSESSSPATPAVTDELEQRARRDRDRMLAGPRDDWTLQFLMACDPANVRPLSEALANEPEFHLLATPHRGQTCYRVCWGRYGSRDHAASVRRLPAALQPLRHDRSPRPIAEIVR